MMRFPDSFQVCILGRLIFLPMPLLFYILPPIHAGFCLRLGIRVRTLADIESGCRTRLVNRA